MLAQPSRAEAVREDGAAHHARAEFIATGMKPGLMNLKIRPGLRSPLRGALARLEGDHAADHRRAKQERRGTHGDQTIALAPPGVFIRMTLRSLDESGGFRRQRSTGLRAAKERRRAACQAG